MQKALLSAVVAIILTMWPATGYCQDASDDVLCQDIGGFKKYNCACRIGTGILVPADHFGGDHKDVSCDVIYHSEAQRMTVKVEVTRHSDPPDANKWLMHELDKEFRTYYGTPDPVYIIKDIDGNTVYAFGSGGWDYRWINGSKVIMVEYHDSRMTKPEPLEIVRAYLARNPSTLPATSTSELRSATNEARWIKDEMDRRLWLCDKWFLYSAFNKAGEKQAPGEPVESMTVFLNYREKYFGVKASDEKNVLVGYLNSNNDAGIKAKLSEYKNWWAANKDKAIRM